MTIAKSEGLIKKTFEKVKSSNKIQGLGLMAIGFTIATGGAFLEKFAGTPLLCTTIAGVIGVGSIIIGAFRTNNI